MHAMLGLLYSEEDRIQNITIGDENSFDVANPYDDALMVINGIADFHVKRVPVNSSSAANVLTWEVFWA